MKSTRFMIEELVPKSVFDKRGDRAWELINPNLITTIDTIKDRFPEGSMSINTWLWNGDRSESGLRTADSPYYSSTSQHSLGNAIDAVFSKYTVEEVRQDIINNPDIYPFVKGIEIDITWLHIDVRNRETVAIFKP